MLECARRLLWSTSLTSEAGWDAEVRHHRADEGKRSHDLREIGVDSTEDSSRDSHALNLRAQAPVNVSAVDGLYPADLFPAR